MAVRRKVFRIEENARWRVRSGSAAASADIRQREFTSESQATRLPPSRQEFDHGVTEQAQEYIAQARAFKHELNLIHGALERTRNDIAVLDGAPQTARAQQELAAIVGGTERATQSILQAAEEIDHAAHALASSLKGSHDRRLANEIQDRVVQIFESCNFQDLTGQRAGQVLQTLKFVEDHMAKLLEIWRGIEAFTPMMPSEIEDDRRFLNGPALANDRDHFSQRDIDAIFRRA